MRLALRQVRVRDHMPVARIEGEQAEYARFLEADTRVCIVEALRELGWRYVTLDLKGFRSRSMNELLP